MANEIVDYRLEQYPDRLCHLLESAKGHQLPDELLSQMAIVIVKLELLLKHSPAGNETHSTKD